MLTARNRTRTPQPKRRPAHPPADPHPPSKLLGRRQLRDRLLTPDEIEKALTDTLLEPLHVLPMSAVRRQLRKLVDEEGGPSAYARLVGCTQSQVSEACSGRRPSLGRKIAAHVGLRPRVLRLLVYEVQLPKKFYRPPFDPFQKRKP